jgi:hypothetical protein
MKNRNANTTDSEPSSSSVETLDNLPRTQKKNLQTRWKPGKSLWKYQTKRAIQNTHTETKTDVKPVHKRVVDLSNELDKNLGHKPEMHLVRFKETELCRWKDKENPTKCNTQRRDWTVNSKLQPLSYQPKANLNERFLNNKLAVLGSKWNLGERTGDNRISLKRPTNVWVEAREIGSVSGSSSQWSAAFTKARVQRLNEVFLSLSEADSMKLRSRRLKCSCLFHQ